ncbi:MAG: NAD(P)H-hydrate dehydratase [Desulfobacteraceae bacterium]
MLVVTAETMQKIDREAIESFGIPGQVLMENAGRSAFEMLQDMVSDIGSKKICILAGRGNNGGDGFVMARYLFGTGTTARVVLLSNKDKIKGDALKNLTLLEKLESETGKKIVYETPDLEAVLEKKSFILNHDLFIDAILGTGLKSDVRGMFKEVIELVNKSGTPIFSVDIPSGLDADTGEKKGVCINAFATATFGLLKTGLVLNDQCTGRVKPIDIGIPDYIVRKRPPLTHVPLSEDIKKFFPPRTDDAHKGNFGHLFILAGSPGKTGAAALCANAAMRCGTGLVTLGVPRGINSAVEPQVCEPMTLPLDDTLDGTLSSQCFSQIETHISGKTAMAAGPGLGTGSGVHELIKTMISQITIPLILDADALNTIADRPEILKEKKAPIVITPHPGEMARLCRTTSKQIQKNRIQAAQTFAGEFEVIVVLKGAKTISALPDGTIFINPTGNPGMASGGMGDVLTGIIAGFTAQGFSLEDAAVAGVYLHGCCGDVLAREKGNFGFLATDMILSIPMAVHDIINGS